MTESHNEYELLLFVAEHVSNEIKITQNDLALFLGVHLNTLRKNKGLVKIAREINQKYIKQSKNSRDTSSSLPKKRKSSTRFKRVENKKYRFVQKNKEFRLIAQDNAQDTLCNLFDSFF